MPPGIRASRAAPTTTLALIIISITIVLIEFGTAVAQSPSFVPVTDRMLQHPAADDWLMWRRTLDGWGYSPLDKIDRDNVGQLRMVWTRGLNGGFQSGTPLAYGGVLYMPNPNDVIQALDAVTGDLIWEHRREIPDDLGEYLNRALAANNRNKCDLRQPHHRHERGRPSRRARRADGPAGVGDDGAGLPRQSCDTGLGTDRRQWQGHLRPQLFGEGRPRRVRGHRPRCRHRGGALEATSDSGAR